MKRARFTDEQIIGMLKALEDENAELKKLLAEAMLDNGAFTDGRRFRVLAVVDDFTRECLALVADTSLLGLRVT